MGGEESVKKRARIGRMNSAVHVMKSVKNDQEIVMLYMPLLKKFDLAANCGEEGVKCICSNSVYWKDFINEQD